MALSEGPITEAAPLSCKGYGWVSRAIEWRGRVDHVVFTKWDSPEEPPR